MLPVNAEEYIDMLKVSWQTKLPLMTYGAPGIGKSDIVRQVFPDIANSMNRKFAEWAHLTHDEKLECIKTPSKYFIMSDQRIGGMDSTDLRGLPKFSGDWIETTPYSWVGYFTQIGAAGVIFLDEINLAPPTVAGQAYEIILSRTVGDRKIAADVLVLGAGNRATDRAFTFEMPMPLRDRFNEIELSPDVETWTKWAAKSGINPHLISFVNWKEMYLYSLDKVKGSDKGSTPRSICRASALIGDGDISGNTTRKYITCSCGQAFAVEFQAYVKYYMELNWAQIFKKPEMVAGFSVDKCWAVSGGLVEKYRKDETLFDSLLDVISYMRKDFAIVSLKMICNADAKKFAKSVGTSKNFSKLAKEYGKYLL